jgi:hypothetical protein
MSEGCLHGMMIYTLKALDLARLNRVAHLHIPHTTMYHQTSGLKIQGIKPGPGRRWAKSGFELDPSLLQCRVH